MIYLGPKVIGNFKPSIDPNKKREPKARDKRPGMDPEHVKNIKQMPSILSGKEPCDAHHLKIKNERGVGLRATDRWCLPLTRAEHMEVEKLGSRREKAWFEARGVDCYTVAKALWSARGDLDAMRRIIEANKP